MKTDTKYVKFEDHLALNAGNQGPLFLAVLAILLGYFGVICNHPALLREINEGLIWHFTLYFKVYYGLPLLILILTCFTLTYVQDIYHYGIKHAFWLVFVILDASILWYWILYGFSWEPLVLLFGRWQGYLQMVLLFVINISSAYAGGQFRIWMDQRRTKKLQMQNQPDEILNDQTSITTPNQEAEK